MKRKRDGFTLIEMTFFLGVSGLLLAGILAMTQTSISQQRFNDVTQTFVEFLKSVYSGASNPQSISNGRSDLAVYGKMITFGETVDLAGNDIPDGEQRIFAYDIVGKDYSGGANNVQAILKNVAASVAVEEKYNDGGIEKTRIVPAGIVEEYHPGWGGVIDGGVKEDGKVKNGEPANVTILVVRTPKTGTITTLVYNNKIEVNQIIREINKSTEPNDENPNFQNLLTDKLGDHLNGSFFKQDQVNFCVNMSGYGKMAEARRNVRIIENARNVSGIQLIDLNGEDNQCE